jgi:plasmid stabilization system protein ParE
MSYVFHPQAEGEYLEAIAFYESRRRGLGAVLVAELERAMTRVCTAPEKLSVSEPPDIRRCNLSRFPYPIIFRQRGQGIEILAVAHHRRRPGFWGPRVK